jgi:hypothetical protein
MVDIGISFPEALRSNSRTSTKKIRTKNNPKTNEVKKIKFLLI